MSRKRGLPMIRLAYVAVAAGVAITLSSCSSPSRPAAGSSPTTSSSPTPSSRTATGSPGTAPVTPAQGAYLGAAVGPAIVTQDNEILAVDSLQRKIGRKLGIVHIYLKWQAAFPTRSDLTFLDQGSTLLISWAGTDLSQIVSGADDTWIRTRAEQIKALGKPVFLEWRWEMDRPNLRSQVHSGADYVAAWDHIRAIFAAAGVRNAAWVWCPTAAGFAAGRVAAYYPGDNEVDWICADAYPQYGSYASFASTVSSFLGWASHHSKPVMIGEFGVPQSYGGQQRARWLRAAQQVVLGDHQIKALVYYDANPAGQGQAESYSLDDDSAAMSAFRSIALQPYFSPAGTG